MDGFVPSATTVAPDTNYSGPADPGNAKAFVDGSTAFKGNDIGKANGRGDGLPGASSGDGMKPDIPKVIPEVLSNGHGRGNRH